MSSYDAAIIDVTILEHPDLLALPRGTRLLHLEGYVWSRAQRTDGTIPRHMLARIAFDEPDPQAAAEQLVTTGLWATTDDGWRIVDFLETQWSRETVHRKRSDNKRRYEKWVAEQDDGKRPTRGKASGKRVGNAFTNDTDADADSDPDPEREGETAKRKSGDAGPRGPVAALAAMRTCAVCHRDFLGEGYDMEGATVCSWKCRDSKPTAVDLDRLGEQTAQETPA